MQQCDKNFQLNRNFKLHIHFNIFINELSFTYRLLHLFPASMCIDDYLNLVIRAMLSNRQLQLQLPHFDMAEEMLAATVMGLDKSVDCKIMKNL